MRARDFVLQAQIEIHELEHWVAEGWLLPQKAGEDSRFFADRSRAGAFHPRHAGHGRQ